MTTETIKQKVGPVFRRFFPRHESDARHALNQIQGYETALIGQGRSFNQFQNILEFGCGYGRLLHHLFSAAPQAKLWGCDISEKDIAWCREKYPQGSFSVSWAAPPLAYPDAQFDLIYSYSVFTHLSEPNHQAWLKELARILKPGGVMLHTTHSALCLKLIRRFSPERLANYKLGGSLEQFLASGKPFHYIPYGPDQLEYGLSVITPDYVRSVWPQVSGLKVSAYLEGAFKSFPEGAQDLVVMTKETP